MGAGLIQTLTLKIFRWEQVFLFELKQDQVLTLKMLNIKKFYIKIFRWERVASLDQKRGGCGLVALNNCLYAIGIYHPHPPSPTPHPIAIILQIVM